MNTKSLSQFAVVVLSTLSLFAAGCAHNKTEAPAEAATTEAAPMHKAEEVVPAPKADAAAADVAGKCAEGLSKEDCVKKLAKDKKKKKAAAKK